ncbi:MAG TPA: hypothetical protein VGN44_12980 [Candidatus Angelobacter sp.]
MIHKYNLSILWQRLRTFENKHSAVSNQHSAKPKAKQQEQKQKKQEQKQKLQEQKQKLQEKELRQDSDKAVEWHFSFCLQQNALPRVGGIRLREQAEGRKRDCQNCQNW